MLTVIPSKKDDFMTSKRLGNIGEAYVLSQLTNFGIPVYLQFGDNEPADYLIIVNDEVFKIQAKTSTIVTDDSVIFTLTSSSLHRNGGTKHIYSTQEVDYFICFDYVNTQLFLVKNTGNMQAITIRYNLPKNNQKKHIHLAKDHLLCVETLHGMSK